MDSSSLLKNKKSVPYEFDNVAKKYDIATFLSQGYQKDLQLSVDRMGLTGNEFIADLCCGTGKSTLACKNKITDGRILGIDNSKEMLEVATTKFRSDNITFQQADVMELDYPDNSFDAIFMAYGIRNMPDFSKCLINLRRILKPNGIICIHEYSIKNTFFHRAYWKFLGYFIIIPVSTLISGSSEIYKYLVSSVLSFPPPYEFSKILKSAGFRDVKRLPMPSWRKPILHTFLATK